MAHSQLIVKVSIDGDIRRFTLATPSYDAVLTALAPPSQPLQSPLKLTWTDEDGDRILLDANSFQDALASAVSQGKNPPVLRLQAASRPSVISSDVENGEYVSLSRSESTVSKMDDASAAPSLIGADVHMMPSPPVSQPEPTFDHKFGAGFAPVAPPHTPVVVSAEELHAPLQEIASYLIPFVAKQLAPNGQLTADTLRDMAEALKRAYLPTADAATASAVNPIEVLMAARMRALNNCHFRITCDGCRQSPLVGPRMKALSWSNFDFCLACYTKWSDMMDKEGVPADRRHIFELIEPPQAECPPFGGRRHAMKSMFSFLHTLVNGNDGGETSNAEDGAGAGCSAPSNQLHCGVGWGRRWQHPFGQFGGHPHMHMSGQPNHPFFRSAAANSSQAAASNGGEPIDSEESILVIVKDLEGETHFKLQKTTPFKAVMTAYAQKRGIPLSQVSLVVNGARLLETDTPASKGIDDDEILVFAAL